MGDIGTETQRQQVCGSLIQREGARAVYRVRIVQRNDSQTTANDRPLCGRG
jgi:hypothetical protein